MKSVDIQTDTNNKYIIKQLLSSLLTRQRNQINLTNLFYQFGPRFNRINQIKLANKINNNHLSLHRDNSSFRFNRVLIKNENMNIVNEMNIIYSKAIQPYPGVNKHGSCLNDIQLKNNQMVSKIKSPQSEFLSTEIKKRHLSGDYSKISRIFSIKDDDNREVRNNNDINYEKLIRSKNRMTIKVRGSRMGIKSNLRDCSNRVKYSNIELKDSNQSLPFIGDRKSNDSRSNFIGKK